ncbi:MAG: T9SS type A sorting domain-containing protein, partial [Bacteroidetes bacterium]|nr:T9SS type A sorting domain-containing protein [Bacteroidota bacterium]
EVKVKNMDAVTVTFGLETVTGFLKELKVKLDKTSTTAAPVVKDFKIDIEGVTTALDVKKGTVTSVEVTIPATTITALATTEYEEKLKNDPAVLGGHTEAEFKRAKNAVTEGVDIASLSDGFNDELKERKGSCSISAAPVNAPKQGGRSVESEPQAEIPEGYVLEPNYPNPFNPTTTIRFSVPEASPVRLVVYDVLGRQVRVLVDGTVSAGMHEVVFEAGDLPSGTYLYRLETPQGSFVKMMQLVK